LKALRFKKEGHDIDFSNVPRKFKKVLDYAIEYNKTHAQENEISFGAKQRQTNYSPRIL
jgi:hypothetical protein